MVVETDADVNPAEASKLETPVAMLSKESSGCNCEVA